MPTKNSFSFLLFFCFLSYSNFDFSLKFDNCYCIEFLNHLSTSISSTHFQSLVPLIKILNYFDSQSTFFLYQLYYTTLNFIVLVFEIQMLHIIYSITISLFDQFYLVNAFLFLFFCFFLVIFNLTLIQFHQIIVCFFPLAVYKHFYLPLPLMNAWPL